jgi:hypothetical protein
MLAVAGIIPATLLVIFSGLVGMIAIVLGSDRRDYALAFVDRCTALAWVLVGVHRQPPRRSYLPGKA